MPSAHGRDTAELVAETARQVLATWGDDLEVVVTDVPPASILAEGADEAAAETVRVAYFAQVRSCPPFAKPKECVSVHLRGRTLPSILPIPST